MSATLRLAPEIQMTLPTAFSAVAPRAVGKNGARGWVTGPVSHLNPTFESIIARHTLGVLATIRRDGRPQVSTVGYHYDPATQTASFSITADRAKTRNLTRDPRATLYVAGDSRWQWAAADGDARLTPVTQGGDQAMSDLEELYRSLAGDHPDWDEFRRDMVAQRRLVLHLALTHAYGMSR